MGHLRLCIWWWNEGRKRRRGEENRKGKEWAEVQKERAKEGRKGKKALDLHGMRRKAKKTQESWLYLQPEGWETKSASSGDSLSLNSTASSPALSVNRHQQESHVDWQSWRSKQYAICSGQWMEDFAIVWLSDLFYMLVHKKVAFYLLLRTLSLWVCLSQAGGT